MNTRVYVAAGFQEDCARLVSRFDEAEDLRFQTFSEIWKDLKFSLIFKGRQTMAELMEFCEEVLHISKQYLLSNRFKERICGLYIIYGVYYKMPCIQFKIRLKLSDWHSIVELHNQIREGEHLDANYILSKLIFDNAFQYCLFDYEFTFERCLREKNNQNNNPYSILPAVKNMTEKDQIFMKVNALSNLYHQKKSKACTTSSTKSCDLNLFNHNFVNEIVNDIQELEKSRQNQQKMSQSGSSKKTTKRIQKPAQDDKKKVKQQKNSHNASSGEPETNELEIDIPDSDSESFSDDLAE